MAARIRDERALLHLLGLSAKPAGAGDGGTTGLQQESRPPCALLLARALSSGGQRAVERYWRSHSSDASSDLGGLGPAAAYVAGHSDQGMPPGAFERLFCGKGGRLADWPEWRARALRDALDPEKRGLLSAEALGLAVAMLAASASAAAATEGGREEEEDGGGMQRRRLRERVWRALAAAGGGAAAEEEEDAQSPDPSSCIPLASVWTCALLMGAEERHLAAAWRRESAGDMEEDDEGVPPPRPTRLLTAAQAEALVAGALKAQNHDPARLALSAPCCGFEWVGGEEEKEVAGPQGGGASLPAAVDGVGVPDAAPASPFVPPAAAPCCGCVIS